MQIKLGRKVVVRCVRVIATLARPAHRPTELALIRWIEERAAAGAEISADQVCAEQTGLLPGRPRVLGQRLLSIADSLRLVETERGRVLRLSEIGREAMKQNEVFIPERCTWSLYFAEEPLLAHPLVHFDVHEEPPAHNEVTGRGPASRNPQTRRQFQRLPAILDALRGQTLVLPSVEKQRVRIDEIEPQCEPAEGTTIHAELRIPMNSVATSKVSGTVAGAKIDSSREWSLLRHWDVFCSLLQQHELLTLWSSRHNALQRQYAELQNNQPSLRSFRQELSLSHPVVNPMGPFDATVIPSVPIVPASDADAQSWLTWLIYDGVKEFCFPAEYQALGALHLKSFPGFRVQVPQQGELASRIRAALAKSVKPPNKPYWYLRAPLDLTVQP